MPRLQANALLLAALIWGSAFVGQAWGMDSMGPLTFTGLRFVLGAAVVAPLAWREWQAMTTAGQRHAPPADAAIMLSSETVFAALFGAVLMGDRLGAYGLFGCALILLCIALVQAVPMLKTSAR